MNPLSTEARTLRSLKKLSLVESVNDELWESLLPHFTFQNLEPSEALFSIGKPSEELFFVMHGEVGLYLPRIDSEDDYFLQSRKRGDTVGDFAVLNGGSHLVTAIAHTKTRVASFPRFAFELLTNIDTRILAHVYESASELSRRVMLANVFISLFDDFDPDTMERLLTATDVRHLEPGDNLLRPGDTADGLYVMVSGRLSRETTDTQGQRIHLAEINKNEIIGESALLTGSKIRHSIYATRESIVARLPKPDFETIIQNDLQRMTAFTRHILSRRRYVTDTAPHQPRKPSPDQNFVLIPLDRRLPLRRFVQQLKGAFAQHHEPLVLDSYAFDTLYGKPKVSQTEHGHIFSPSIAAWMNDKETLHSHVLYVAEHHWSHWTRRCVNRADRIILVANATTDNSKAIRSIETDLERHYRDTHYRPRIELVLVHPADTDQPRNTNEWLRPRHVDSFHHVRIGDSQHIGRLMRRLTGSATGLVFSGGGARGFAHLGVQRALEEYQQPIDYIGGASMGGLLGGAMAMGNSYRDVYKFCEKFANSKALFDYTLPLTSLMKSAKLTAFCHSVYRDVKIEDLWVPFFCVSSNLNDGNEVIHTEGYLWRAVRSTISLPGIFSPVPTIHCQLLIDGAVLNTFPVDIMEQKLAGGRVLGVNVSQLDEVVGAYSYGTAISGWRILLSRLNPFTKGLPAPRIIETLLRATDIKSLQRLNETRQRLDVLIEPDVSDVELLDFKSFCSISEKGYFSARKVLFSGDDANQTVSDQDSVTAQGCTIVDDSMALQNDAAARLGHTTAAATEVTSGASRQTGGAVAADGSRR